MPEQLRAAISMDRIREPLLLEAWAYTPEDRSETRPDGGGRLQAWPLRRNSEPPPPRRRAELLRRNRELAANLPWGLMVSNVSMALSIIDVSKVTP